MSAFDCGRSASRSARAARSLGLCLMAGVTTTAEERCYVCEEITDNAEKWMGCLLCQKECHLKCAFLSSESRLRIGFAIPVSIGQLTPCEKIELV